MLVGDNRDQAAGDGQADILADQMRIAFIRRMHSHRTVLWAMLTLSATSDMRNRDRFLTSLPLFHVGALTPAMGCVYLGITQVILKVFDPKLSWELIRDEKITSTLMVPAMLQFMLATYDQATHDVRTLRWMMSGAAPRRAGAGELDQDLRRHGRGSPSGLWPHRKLRPGLPDPG